MSPSLVVVGALGTGCSAEDIKNFVDDTSDDYFVKLEAEPAEVAGLASEIADLLDIKVVHTYDSASEGFATRFPPILAPEVRKLDEVDYVKRVDRDDWTPPEENPDPDIEPDPSEITRGISRIGGPSHNMGASSVEVAVIDTGVDGAHPDLYVVASFDAVCESTPSDCAPDADPNGHGTHVAGTIGAVANGEGVVGVAPGVAIHGVRVLGSGGSGTWTDIIAGCEYVLDYNKNGGNIRVVNMSLGGFGSPDTNDKLAQAIKRLEDSGVLVAIAAGNSTENTDGFVPAGYDYGVVVSAYDVSGGSDNGFAWFSNFGDEVDIAAPGVSIKSTFPGGEYASLDGTSMATPHVAGAAAAYFDLFPNKSPGDARRDLRSSGEGGLPDMGGKHPEGFLDTCALGVCD